MAIPKQPSIIFLLLALVTLSFTTTSNAVDCVGAGAISVYWGQRSEKDEGTLKSACASGNYDIVILESLIVFDDEKTPVLNLDNHCGSPDNPCSNLQPEIEYCQQNNVKVFLSIGQDSKTKTLKPTNRHSIATTDPSDDAANNLTKYLLDNFLSGQPGPLGSVSLDGIDIADVADGDNLKWDKVVTSIYNASLNTSTKIYLSASPQCVYPDYYLDTAIRTGHFDYIWVEFFYQNPCIYSNGNPSNLLSAWDEWTKNVPNSLIFLGLVASDKDKVPGYITPESLVSEVLPIAKQASNYGGVMIWDRYYDIQNNYTAQIRDSVPKGCRCVCDGDGAFASKGFYGL